MCGICGIVAVGNTGPSISSEVLQRMNQSIAHRGPDDDGFYVTHEVGLASRRLSIIDLATGRQPITNEDSTVWIVFNGEIYNYRELRSYLDKHGHVFTTSSDTETILHLYEEFGSECVQHLNGIFAFAIWDVKKQKLLLARRLDAHAADADQVGLRRERQRLNVLVDDADLPVRRTQRRERGEPQRRVERALAAKDAFERPAEAPEALRQRRIDEEEPQDCEG